MSDIGYTIFRFRYYILELNNNIVICPSLGDGHTVAFLYFSAEPAAIVQTAVQRVQRVQTAVQRVPRWLPGPGRVHGLRADRVVLLPHRHAAHHHRHPAQPHLHHTPAVRGD